MKNLFKTTFYVAVFALAGILFQISCSNSDNETLSTNSLGKLIYMRQMDSGGTLVTTICTCNYDGTNETPIDITLPAGSYIDFNSLEMLQLKMSPDGQKVFFVVRDAAMTKSLYSCDITGANPTEVLHENFQFGGAY